MRSTIISKVSNVFWCHPRSDSVAGWSVYGCLGVCRVGVFVVAIVLEPLDAPESA